MIWRIVKFVLRLAEIRAHLIDGDQLSITIKIGGHTVIDRVIDIIPGA